MSELLVLLKPDASSDINTVQRKVTESGGQIKQSYGGSVLIVDASSDTVDTLESQAHVSVFRETVPAEAVADLDETARLGVAAWNERHSESFRTSKRERKGEGLPWDHPDYDREG
jgi:hypothetical protein